MANGIGAASHGVARSCGRKPRITANLLFLFAIRHSQSWLLVTSGWRMGLALQAMVLPARAGANRESRRTSCSYSPFAIRHSHS
jgi:hypothetical protein